MAQSRSRVPEPLGLTVTYNGIANEIQCAVTISAPHDPDNYKAYNALWDTGASQTVVSLELVASLALKSIGPGLNYTAGEIRKANRYLINLHFPNVAFPGLQVIDSPLPQPPNRPRFDLLIGMDIITRGDLTISNYQGQTCLSFRMPSAERTDYVKQINVRRNTGRRRR